MSNAWSVYTTLPDEEAARRTARILVDERLAACANFFPIGSIYRWKGEVQSEREWALVIKTRDALYPRLEARLRELHPYEVPAIVAYAIAAGLPDYLEWIERETGAAEPA